MPLNNYKLWIICFMWLFYFAKPVSCWDSEQLEIFDLVEEINQNFYTLLNVSQDANITAIKKAFRTLSLQLHPDKNDSPDADQQFRHLVSAYEVLKEPDKRQHYDEVLKNGLPNWRSAVYYYRHVRKVGLLEMTVILFIIVTIGQYIVGWAVYLEMKFLAEEEMKVRLKKQSKKIGKRGNVPINIDVAELEVPKPSFSNTLPVQIPKLFFSICKSIPTILCSIVNYVKHQIIEAKMAKMKDNEESSDETPVIVKAPKKRKPAFIPAERSDEDLPNNHRTESVVHPEPPTNTTTPIVGGLWTDDDLNDLVHLANKKYPVGTADRWNKIAEAMHRSVPEIVYMANKLKERNIHSATEEEPASAQEQEETMRKRKTRAADTAPSNGNEAWSQVQQKALEMALAKHPKGPADRWDKIARCVPDKSKEECMLRYKHLVQVVSQKKATEKI